jgi:hypothetical protein
MLKYLKRREKEGECPGHCTPMVFIFGTKNLKN